MDSGPAVPLGSVARRGPTVLRDPAQRILERVNAAYEVLRKRLDPTESRFARLEL